MQTCFLQYLSLVYGYGEWLMENYMSIIIIQLHIKYGDLPALRSTRRKVYDCHSPICAVLSLVYGCGEWQLEKYVSNHYPSICKMCLLAFSKVPCWQSLWLSLPNFCCARLGVWLLGVTYGELHINNNHPATSETSRLAFSNVRQT